MTPISWHKPGARQAQCVGAHGTAQPPPWAAPASEGALGAPWFSVWVQSSLATATLGMSAATRSARRRQVGSSSLHQWHPARPYARAPMAGARPVVNYGDTRGSACGPAYRARKTRQRPAAAPSARAGPAHRARGTGVGRRAQRAIAQHEQACPANAAPASARPYRRAGRRGRQRRGGREQRREQRRESQARHGPGVVFVQPGGNTLDGVGRDPSCHKSKAGGSDVRLGWQSAPVTGRQRVAGTGGRACARCQR